MRNRFKLPFLVAHAGSASAAAPSKRAFCLLISLSMASVLPVTAVGRDLNVLVRISYAAFLADDGSAICAGSRLNFSSEDQKLFQDAKSYALWIKQRVSAGLSEDDIRNVVVSAADRARSDTRQALKTLPSELALREWCVASVAPLARQVIGAYMRNRGVIEGMIEDAKKE